MVSASPSATAPTDPAANDPGNDQYFGEAGSDQFFWDPGDGSDTIEGGAGDSDQLFFSCDPDEQVLPFAVEFLGEDRITYASDYPHHDAKFPDSVRMIWEHPKLSESARRKILGGNAARLLSLNSVRGTSFCCQAGENST